MTKIPERILWVVDVLDVRPTDIILEIGCGTGLAIGPVCNRLSEGHLTAIDRSSAQLEKAKAANADAIASGKAEILLTEFLEAELPAAHFDKIFLFNINVFWMDPKAELAEIERLLKPEGRFYLFHQPPPGSDLKEYQSAFVKNLEAGRFAVTDILEPDSATLEALGVIAKPFRIAGKMS